MDKEKERKLQYRWYHNFRSYLAGAEGLEVAPQKHSRIARLERSHCSLFLHLTAVPSSATGGGTAARPGTLRVPGLHIIRSKAKTKRHP